MMDLSLSLETQSNVSIDHQEAEDGNETREQGRHHLRRGIRYGGGHGADIRARSGQGGSALADWVQRSDAAPAAGAGMTISAAAVSTPAAAETDSKEIRWLTLLAFCCIKT